MRWTIGLKIFGIAALLMALMIAVAALSTEKLRQTADRVDVLATYLVPISNRLDNMETHLLEQELAVERIMRALDGPAPDQALVEGALQAFEAYGRDLDAEAERAMAMAQAGIDAARAEDSRLALAQLVPRIRSVERQHQEFHDLVIRLIAARQDGRLEAGAELGQMLEPEAEDFRAEATALSRELQGLTEAAATATAADEHQALRFNILLTGLAVAVGVMFAALLTRGLVRPVRTLLEGTRLVESGQLDRDIPVLTSDEIGDLARSFNHMVAELRVKEQIKDAFGKYLDPRVVEGLLRDGQDGGLAALRGERQLITVLFSDLVGFTSISEQMTPDGLVRLINGYFTLATESIGRHSGVLDKYIGDAVMAFWSPPFVGNGQQARLGTLAALDQLAQLEEFRRRLPELMGLRKGLPFVDLRIGLATGEAVVGNIGSEQSKSFTVMGDTVNLASRLEGANKTYGTRILICERTRQLAGDAIATREVDAITVVGRSEPVRIFELLGKAGSLPAEIRAGYGAFEQGLAAYRARSWKAAEEGFRACLAACPEDRPSEVLLERLERLAAEPAGEHWDGVWRMQTK